MNWLEFYGVLGMMGYFAFGVREATITYIWYKDPLYSALLVFFWAPAYALCALEELFRDMESENSSYVDEFNPLSDLDPFAVYRKGSEETIDEKTL